MVVYTNTAASGILVLDSTTTCGVLIASGGGGGGCSSWNIGEPEASGGSGGLIYSRVALTGGSTYTATVGSGVLHL